VYHAEFGVTETESGIEQVSIVKFCGGRSPSLPQLKNRALNIKLQLFEQKRDSIIAFSQKTPNFRRFKTLASLSLNLAQKLSTCFGNRAHFVACDTKCA
jgi:hypothetical protein